MASTTRRVARCAALIVAILGSTILFMAYSNESGTINRADNLVKAMIAKADRVVVRSLPSEDSKIIFQSTDSKDRDALAEAMTIEYQDPNIGFAYAHKGTTTIFLYSGNRLLMQLTDYGARAVSTPMGMRRISTPEKMLAWFDERGVGMPRAIYW